MKSILLTYFFSQGLTNFLLEIFRVIPTVLYLFKSLKYTFASFFSQTYQECKILPSTQAKHGLKRPFNAHSEASHRTKGTHIGYSTSPSHNVLFPGI